jgi:uncharacterized DUF497 family protein
MITFTWDKRKAQNNLKKHNVSFEEATEIWNDEFAAFLHDPSHSDNEDTYIMIGYSSKNNLLFVSFTERNKDIRIISARKATKNERKRHQENQGKY